MLESLHPTARIILLLIVTISTVIILMVLIFTITITYSIVFSHVYDYFDHVRESPAALKPALERHCSGVRIRKIE